MLPADPTPPLTERDLAELRIIASADVAFGLPHGPLLRRLVKEHATLTAALAQRTAERDALRTLMMTLADVAQEAAAPHQSYDFKHRAHFAAQDALALLAAPTEG